MRDSWLSYWELILYIYTYIYVYERLSAFQYLLQHENLDLMFKNLASLLLWNRRDFFNDFMLTICLTGRIDSYCGNYAIWMSIFNIKTFVVFHSSLSFFHSSAMVSICESCFFQTLNWILAAHICRCLYCRDGFPGISLLWSALSLLRISADTTNCTLIIPRGGFVLDGRAGGWNSDMVCIKI